MTNFIEALLVFSAGILTFALGSLLFEKIQAFERKLTNMEHLIHLWGRSVAICTLILYIAMHQTNGLRAMGLRGERGDQNFATVFWTLGLAGAILLLLSLIMRLRNQGKQPAGIDSTVPQVGTIACYDHPLARSAYLTALSLIVIGEEFLSRGYLVLMMVERTGFLIPWIVLSVSFSIVAHLYQGRNWATVITHALFALYFITMALLAKNLIAAIAPHLYYDILWTIGVWKRVDKQSPEAARQPVPLQERLFYLGFIAVNVVLVVYFVFILG